MSNLEQRIWNNRDRVPHGSLMRHIDDVLSLYGAANLDRFVNTLPPVLRHPKARQSIKSSLTAMIERGTVTRTYEDSYILTAHPPTWRELLAETYPYGLAILNSLGERDCTLYHVCTQLGRRTQYTVDHKAVGHALRKLEDSGLVEKTNRFLWRRTTALDTKWSRPTPFPRTRKSRVVTEAVARDPDGMT